MSASRAKDPSFSDAELLTVRRALLERIATLEQVLLVAPDDLHARRQLKEYTPLAARIHQHLLGGLLS